MAGRVIVVTGAASGIGNSIARQLACVHCSVALLDRDAAVEDLARELRDGGADALALVCDVTDEVAVAAAAELVASRLGPCDGLVNNAGIMPTAALLDVTLGTWNHTLDVNLSGALVCARTFGRQMVARGRGAIVNLGSISGVNPQPRGGAYSASKAALMMLSRQFAVEWGPLGLRSNAVCPGMIQTPLSEHLYAGEEMIERRSRVTASRRIGTTGDIADVVLFMLSDRSGYINAAEILVDGGLTSMIMDMIPRAQTASH